MNKKHQETAKSQRIYTLGGIASAIAILVIVADIVIGTITGADLTALPQTAMERFNQLEQNWLLGLYNLDLLNAINQLILIPTFFAIYIALSHSQKEFALLAFILFVTGSIIMVTGNAALPMLELSSKYHIATAHTQLQLLAAAGEAVLIQGEHGSKAMFIGFALPPLASTLFSALMVENPIFRKATGYLGLFGNALMLTYVVLITFIPSTKSVALTLAMPGGLMVLVWLLMLTAKLFKLGSLKLSL